MVQTSTSIISARCTPWSGSGLISKVRLRCPACVSGGRVSTVGIRPRKGIGRLAARLNIGDQLPDAAPHRTRALTAVSDDDRTQNVARGGPCSGRAGAGEEMAVRQGCWGNRRAKVRRRGRARPRRVCRNGRGVAGPRGGGGEAPDGSNLSGRLRRAAPVRPRTTCRVRVC